jgi:homoserine O-acetyltransferase
MTENKTYDGEVNIHYLPEITLDCGVTLKDVPVAFTTYGEKDDSNAVILVQHPGTFDTKIHVWWPNLLGKTDSHCLNYKNTFVICVGNLGTPFGSCSPLTHPETFPEQGVTPRDNVRMQHELLASRFGINFVDMVIGCSLGGAHAIEWGLMYGDQVGKIVAISTYGKADGWLLSWTSIVRSLLDVDYGKAWATMLMAFSGPENFESKYREEEDVLKRLSEVQSFFQHQQDKFPSCYNLDCFKQLLNTLSCHDIDRDRADFFMMPKSLLIWFDSDILFPAAVHKSLQDRLGRNVQGVQLTSKYGHDGVLRELDLLNKTICNWLSGNDTLEQRDAEEKYLAANEAK